MPHQQDDVRRVGEDFRKIRNERQMMARREGVRMLRVLIPNAGNFGATRPCSVKVHFGVPMA
jgi:hypothetical protein